MYLTMARLVDSPSRLIMLTVQILSVGHKHDEEPLDIPTDEGIHILGQSVGSFILWNEIYIVLAPPRLLIETEHDKAQGLWT